MNCNDVRSYIDEASPSELRSPRSSVRGHVDSCAACAASLRLRLLVTATLAEATAAGPASEAFRGRVRAALGSSSRGGAREAPPARARGFWKVFLSPSPAWAAAAVVLVTISGWNYLRTLGYFAPSGEVPADMGHLIRDVGHDAYLCSRKEQSLEVLTGDPQEVEGWFSSRVDFPVRVARAGGSDYTLEGARLWHTLSRLAALVRYAGPQGEGVTLFLVSGENLAPRGGEILRRGGHRYHVGGAFTYRVVAWMEEGVAYALAGKLGVEELLRIADSMRPAERPEGGGIGRGGKPRPRPPAGARGATEGGGARGR